MNKLPTLFDKVTPFISSENQWIVVFIFVSLSIFAFVFKHYKELSEFRLNKQKNQLDTLKQLTDDINEKLYQDSYNLEAQHVFFRSLFGKNESSLEKQKLLLNLFNSHILTKNEIEQYLDKFKVCKEKIYVLISVMDWLETIWFIITSLIFVLFVILIFIENVLTPKIMVLIIVFELLALYFLNSSLKLFRLKKVIKKLKENHYYIEHPC